ncbi:hypothetical protein [Sulfuriferula thiophila]|uniref:hypothetical protein n=1 Tax=Sulfuriferula thiophila TaxID=1781211 RepID=UPI000F60E4B5|nr:hypothetical protein [Sulfuriferula thiophila]
MDFNITTVLNFTSILFMFYCLYLVLSLKSSIPGGMVGKRWNFLTMLVVLFTIGYLATPFFDQLPDDILRLVVSCIFLFGAIYVVVTVRLIFNIIRELTE